MRAPLMNISSGLSAAVVLLAVEGELFSVSFDFLLRFADDFSAIV
jgi:hypothetical protein